jgi:hypothetical protein
MKATDAEDLWPEFGPLGDAPATTDGPEGIAPWSHNHRVGPRLPHGWTVGQSWQVHTARHRIPAEVDDDADEAGTLVATPGDVDVRPSGSSEALAWREDVGFRELDDELDGSLAFEVARLDVPTWGVTNVERLATYLRATPLDDAGEPAGPTFVTACCVDPFGPVHPTTDTRLRVRWSLIGANSGDPSFDGPAHGVLGRTVQLATHWFDLRYAWGSRYTCGLQLLVPPDITSVRLVATPDAGGSNWSIAVGGRLVVWSIGGGPREAALTAATHRQT